MTKSTGRRENDGRRLIAKLGGRSDDFAAVVVGLMTVMLVLFAMWGMHQLGSLLGAMVTVALLCVLGVSILVLARADALLAPMLCLSLIFPLNRTLGSTPFVVYTFDLVLACLYAVWIFRAATGRATSIRFSNVDKMALVFIGWLCISALGGTDVFSGLNGALYFFRLYLVYVYVANNVTNVTTVKYVLGSLLLLVAFQSSISIIQYLTRSSVGSISDLVGEATELVREVEVVSGYLFRVRGTLNTDTALSHWFELLLPGVFSLVLARRVDAIGRGVFFVLLLMGTVSLVLTFTRGAWVGFCAATVVVVFLWLRERAFRLGNLVLMALVLIVLGALLLPLSGAVGARWFGSGGETLAVRSQINNAALRMIQQYPIFGVGWDNFAANAPDFGVGFYWAEEGAIHKAHNVYLAVASEGGIVGLIIFLGLLLVVFQVGWHNMKHSDPWAGALTIGILAGFAGALVHSLVAWGLVTYSVFPLFWFLMGLLVAVGRVFSEEEEQETRSVSAST